MSRGISNEEIIHSIQEVQEEANQDAIGLLSLNKKKKAQGSYTPRLNLNQSKMPVKIRIDKYIQSNTALSSPKINLIKNRKGLNKN